MKLTKSEFIDFEDWMLTKGFARTTIKDTLRKIRYLDRRMDLAEREAILGYLRLERRSGATKQKVNGYIKYLNRWLQFTQREKIEYLPDHRNKSFKRKEFDQEQLKAILSKTSEGISIEEKRNHAMILLALNTGLRRAELANLRVSDIGTYYVRVVNGKGEKDRDVFIDERTRDLVLRFATIRNSPGTPNVFTTKKGPISPPYMGKIAETIKKRTGVDAFSWHKCRHTYAKNLIRNGIDLETIRQMLGHEDLDTTGIYAELDADEAIERVMKKNVKFYKAEFGCESPKPWYIQYGPMGI